MRTHGVFPAFQPWAHDAALLRDLVGGDRLAVMRIEPVTRGREAGAFLDFTFADDARIVCLPLVYLDLAQLDVREFDPLVFPRAVADLLDENHVNALMERVFGDLERRAHAGGFWNEEVVAYRALPRFDAARERGLFGAAALAVSIPRIAPAIYARRFARNKHVAAYGADAPEYAAFLRDVATSVSALDPSDEHVAGWYGACPLPADDAIFELTIGEGPPPVPAATAVRVDAAAPGAPIDVVAPLPADLVLSFDAADGPAAARFVVAAAREPFVRTMPPIPYVPEAGGSAGRIAIVVRANARAVPDADTDEAATLALALQREGFTTSIASTIDELAAAQPDLIHLFGARPGGFALRVAEWASEHRVPLALHAYYEAPAAGGYWGEMVAPFCFSYSADDRSVSTYLDSMARRAVDMDGVSAALPYAPAAAGIAEAERVIRAADIVFVNSEREFAIVSALRAGRLTYTVPPLALAGDEGAPVGVLTGSDPYVLVHAPIGPADNQLVVARATARVKVPLVLAGPVADPTYAERLREFAGNVQFIPEPAPAVRRTLYHSAAIVADAAWLARGHARLLNAAAAGAAVVHSQSRWVDVPVPERWRVDPADVESVARGIGEALDAALRRDEAIDVAAAHAAKRLGEGSAVIVAAYAKIAERV